MQEKNIIFRKGLVFWIIILFIGASFIPSTGGNIKFKETNKILITQLLPDPVGQWSFDNSTYPGHDYSGNGNDGIIYGATWTPNGISNGALSFDGQNDYVMVPHAGILNPPVEITVSAWVYFDYISTVDPPFIIFKKGDGGPEDEIYKLGVADYENLAEFRINSDPVEGGELNTGQWYHIAGTFNGNVKRLYLNGVMVAYENQSSEIETSDNNIYMGADFDGGPNQFLDGIIDEIRIYNVSFSTEEIKILYYNPGGAESGLIGYWNFNDGNANDYSGYDRNGVIYGATYHSSGGPDDSGYFEFDGNDYIAIPNTDGLAFNNQDFTFACWAQIYNNADYYRYFISLGDPDYFNYNFVIIGKLRSGATDGRLIVCLYDSPTNQFGVNSNLKGDELPKYEWFHLVGVYDYTNNALKMYYNSVLQDDISYFDNYDLICSPLELNIGRLICPYAHNYHVGKIDDVRLYNRVLSQSEIDNLYSQGGGNQPPVADFMWIPLDPDPGETITFDASDSYDPDGSIVLYQWDWDDDGMFDENNPTPTTTYSWDESGSYPITLKVIDNENKTGTITHTIFVGESPLPVAEFTWAPPNPTMDETITFDASDSYDPNGDIILYQWDWDDDGVFDESNSYPTATYSWSDLGSYPVTLRVIDNDNLTDSVTKIVNIIYILVPDNFPTIQEAVDYSESGYYILVDDGIYEENIVIDVELLTLQAVDNKGEVVIDGSGIDNAIRVMDNAYGVSISGFTIKNSGSGYAGIRIESGFNDIWDNKIIQNGAGLRNFKSVGNQFHDNIIQNNLLGVDIDEHSHGNIIKNNNIKSNTNHGIFVDDFSTGNLIQGNNIADNTNYGILIEDVSKGNLIIYNDFERNNYGVYCSGSSDANLFHHNSFVDNSVFNAWDSSVDRWDDDVEGNYWDDYTGEDNDGDGIGDTPYYIPGGDNVDRYPLIYPPFSDQLIINQFNRNYEKVPLYKSEINRENINPLSFDVIYVPDDFPTIKDAVVNSNDFDTIIVRQGTYNENDIVVDKPLIIMGENADADVIVDGGGENYHVFLVTANNVEISGFIIRNNDPGKAGVMVMGNFSDVHDNVFFGCGSGVEVLGRFDKIHDIVIEGNSMSNNKWGVYVSNCVDSQVENNGNIIGNVDGIEIGFSSVEIVDNVIKSSDEQGIIGQFCDNVVINGNELSFNGLDENVDAAGIQILNSENCLVDDNVISSNYKDGVLLFMSSGNDIVNNDIVDNSGCPLLIASESSGNVVENNLIRTSYVDGVTIRNSDGNLVHRNDITNSGNLDCITLRTSCDNTIEENDFFHSPLIDNNMGGFRLYSSSFDNLCVHNNFYGGCDAWDECDNSWDDACFCGNYWENYQGPDVDGDGIGDDHYDILGGSRDDYPLMFAWDPPGRADKPVGQSNVETGVEYVYSTSASDPNGFQVCYGWDWDGDLEVNDWTPFYNSGKVVSIPHKWHDYGAFYVSVIVKNERGQVSVWSDSLKVDVPRGRLVFNHLFLDWFSHFTSMFPILKILFQ